LEKIEQGFLGIFVLVKMGVHFTKLIMKGRFEITITLMEW